MIDLDRHKIMPFVCHRSRVKTLATVSSVCILSGGEGDMGGGGGGGPYFMHCPWGDLKGK